MGMLSNPKWEAMAGFLAKGYSADRAYTSAGFKRDRQHAHALSKKANVQARVKELRAAMAKHIEQTAGYDALTIFNRIRMRTDAAAIAGDHKSALAGEMFIAECFGFKDSPTLTHEKINGEKLAAEHSPASGEEAGAQAEPMGENVMRFGPVLAELRKKREAR